MDKRKLTESAGGAAIAQGWSIIPNNCIVLIDQAPPKNMINLSSSDLTKDWNPFEYTYLVEVIKRINLENDIHNNLLEQSLKDNEDLWEALAKI